MSICLFSFNLLLCAFLLLSHVTRASAFFNDYTMIPFKKRNAVNTSTRLWVFVAGKSGSTTLCRAQFKVQGGLHRDLPRPGTHPRVLCQSEPLFAALSSGVDLSGSPWYTSTAAILVMRDPLNRTVSDWIYRHHKEEGHPISTFVRKPMVTFLDFCRVAGNYVVRQFNLGDPFNCSKFMTRDGKFDRMSWFNCLYFNQYENPSVGISAADLFRWSHKISLHLKSWFVGVGTTENLQKTAKDLRFMVNFDTSAKNAYHGIIPASSKVIPTENERLLCRSMLGPEYYLYEAVQQLFDMQ